MNNKKRLVIKRGDLVSTNTTKYRVREDSYKSMPSVFQVMNASDKEDLEEIKKATGMVLLNE